MPLKQPREQGRRSDARAGKGAQRPRGVPEDDVQSPLRPAKPTLRFTPTAWANLLFFCHHGRTEVGGFGVTRPEDLLLIEDFVTVKQEATVVSIAFDDTAVADFFEAQVDAGRIPGQFGRIWLHTHPGNSPMPSGTDEETFARVFGGCDWAVLFILAEGGKTYARLRFNVGPGGHGEIPVEVDYSEPFTGSDHALWKAEYEKNITAVSWMSGEKEGAKAAAGPQEPFGCSSEDFRRMALEAGFGPEEILFPGEVEEEVMG
jgi:hypothetical protein